MRSKRHWISRKYFLGAALFICASSPVLSAPKESSSNSDYQKISVLDLKDKQLLFALVDLSKNKQDYFIITHKLKGSPGYFMPSDYEIFTKTRRYGPFVEVLFRHNRLDKQSENQKFCVLARHPDLTWSHIYKGGEVKNYTEVITADENCNPPLAHATLEKEGHFLSYKNKRYGPYDDIFGLARTYSPGGIRFLYRINNEVFIRLIDHQDRSFGPFDPEYYRKELFQKNPRSSFFYYNRADQAMTAMTRAGWQFISGKKRYGPYDQVEHVPYPSLPQRPYQLYAQKKGLHYTVIMGKELGPSDQKIICAKDPRKDDYFCRIHKPDGWYIYSRNEKRGPYKTLSIITVTSDPERVAWFYQAHGAPESGRARLMLDDQDYGEYDYDPKDPKLLRPFFQYTGDKNHHVMKLQNDQGEWFIHGKKLLGPFEKVQIRSGYNRRLQNYIIYRDFSTHWYLRHLGKEYGPFSNITPRYVTKDDILFYFEKPVKRGKPQIYTQMGETTLGPFEKVEATGIYQNQKIDQTALKYQQNRKWHVYFRQKSYGPFDLIHSIKTLPVKNPFLTIHYRLKDKDYILYHDLDRTRYSPPCDKVQKTLAGHLCFQNQKSWFVSQGTNHGPFDEVISYGLIDSQKPENSGVVFSYRQNKKWYLQFGDTRYGPREKIRPVQYFYFDKKHRPYSVKIPGAYMFREKGLWYASILNQRYGPYEIKENSGAPDDYYQKRMRLDLNPSLKGLYMDQANKKWLLVFFKKGDLYFNYSGKEYGPFRHTSCDGDIANTECFEEYAYGWLFSKKELREIFQDNPEMFEKIQRFHNNDFYSFLIAKRGKPWYFGKDHQHTLKITQIKKDSQTPGAKYEFFYSINNQRFEPTPLLISSFAIHFFSYQNDTLFWLSHEKDQVFFHRLKLNKEAKNPHKR